MDPSLSTPHSDRLTLLPKAPDTENENERRVSIPAAHTHLTSSSTTTQNPAPPATTAGNGSSAPRLKSTPATRQPPRWKAVPKTTARVREYDNLASRWYVDRTPWVSPGVVPEVVRVVVKGREGEEGVGIAETEKVDAVEDQGVTVAPAGKGEDAVIQEAAIPPPNESPETTSFTDKPPQRPAESQEAVVLDSPIECEGTVLPTISENPTGTSKADVEDPVVAPTGQDSPGIAASLELMELNPTREITAGIGEKQLDNAPELAVAGSSETPMTDGPVTPVVAAEELLTLQPVQRDPSPAAEDVAMGSPEPPEPIQQDPMESTREIPTDAAPVEVPAETEDQDMDLDLDLDEQPAHRFLVNFDSPSGPSPCSPYFESPYIADSHPSPEPPIVYPSLSQFSQITTDDAETTREPTPTPPIKRESREDSPSEEMQFPPPAKPVLRQTTDVGWSQEVGKLLNAIGHASTQAPSTAAPTPAPISTPIPVTASAPAPAAVAENDAAPPAPSQPPHPPSPSAFPAPILSSPPHIATRLPTPPKPSVPSRSQTPSDSDSDSDEPVIIPRRRKAAGSARPTSLPIRPQNRLETPISVSTSPNFSETPTPEVKDEPTAIVKPKKHLKRKRDLPDSQSQSVSPSLTPSVGSNRMSPDRPPRKRSARTTRASLAVSHLPEHIERNISNCNYTQVYSMKFIMEHVPSEDIFDHLIQCARLGAFGVAEESRIDCSKNDDLRAALGNIMSCYLQHSLELEANPPELSEQQYEVLKSGAVAFEDWLCKLMMSINVRLQVLSRKKPPRGVWEVTVFPKPPSPPPPPPPPPPGPSKKGIKEEISPTPPPGAKRSGNKRTPVSRKTPGRNRSGSALITSYFSFSSSSSASGSPTVERAGVKQEVGPKPKDALPPSSPLGQEMGKSRATKVAVKRKTSPLVRTRLGPPPPRRRLPSSTPSPRKTTEKSSNKESSENSGVKKGVDGKLASGFSLLSKSLKELIAQYQSAGEDAKE